MATSMLGATVMPHAIYLHSTLVNDHYAPRRSEAEREEAASRQQNRRCLGADTCRLGEPRAAHPRRELAVRHDRHRHHRRRAAGHPACARPGDRHDFLDWSACVEPELHVGRHLRRQRNHARPAAYQSADVGVPSGDAGTRAGGAMVRQQSDGSADRRPGRVVGRHSICDYSADALHARPHADGGSTWTVRSSTSSISRSPR